MGTVSVCFPAGWSRRGGAADPRPQVCAVGGQCRLRRHVQLYPRHPGGRNHHSRRGAGRLLGSPPLPLQVPQIMVGRRGGDASTRNTFTKRTFRAEKQPPSI
jgi:hypothetical protein